MLFENTTKRLRRLFFLFALCVKTQVIPKQKLKQLDAIPIPRYYCWNTYGYLITFVILP